MAWHDLAMMLQSRQLPDGPSLMAALARHAVEGITPVDGLLDLGRTLVLVPAGRARRALERHLVAIAQERDCALIAPEIVTPGRFASCVVVPQAQVLDDVGIRLAWRTVLARSDRAHLQALMAHVPEAGAADQRNLHALADRLASLLREVVSAGMTLKQLAQRMQERAGAAREADLETWRAILALEEQYRALLDRAGVADPTLAAAQAVETGEIHVGARDRVLVLLADPEELQRRLLRALAKRGVRVEVLVHATDALPAPLDAEGFPDREAWSNAMVAVPQERILLAEAPRDQAAAVLQAIAAMPAPHRSDEIVVSVPDQSVAAQVETVLPAVGLPVNPLPRRTAAATPLGTLIRGLSGLLRERTAETLAVLVRHPYVGEWLKTRIGAAADPVRAVTEFRASFDADRLPEGDLRERLHPADVRAVVTQLDALMNPLRDATDFTGRMAAVRATLAALMPTPLSDLDREAIEKYESIEEKLDGLPALLSAGLNVEQMLTLLYEGMDEATLATEGNPASIELMGWLEAGVDDAPLLVLTGMNDGIVPEGMIRDAWVPDSVRAQIGMPCARRRQARDAWILHAMLARKRGVWLVVGRTNSDGDPLQPSRLVLGLRGEALARRVAWIADPRAKRADARQWIAEPTGAGKFIACQPPEGETRISAVSATQFRDFLQCPYLFRLKRDPRLRLDCVDDSALELDAARFGSLLHSVLQAWGRAEAQRLASGREPTLDAGEVQSQLLLELDRVRREEWPASLLGVVEVQFALARERLIGFAPVQARWAAEGWRIRFAELGFEVDADATVDANVRPAPLLPESTLRLTGRIDRVDWHPVHGYAALDYKTSTESKDPETEHYNKRSSQWIDLQLPLYRALLASAEMLVAPTHLGYIALTPDPRQTKFTLTKGWDESMMNQAMGCASEIAQAIEAGEFDRNPAFTPPAGTPFAVLYGVGMRGLATGQVQP